MKIEYRICYPVFSAFFSFKKDLFTSTPCSAREVARSARPSHPNLSAGICNGGRVAGASTTYDVDGTALINYTGNDSAVRRWLVS